MENKERILALISEIKRFAVRFDADFVAKIKEILTVTKADSLEKLILSGKTDRIYNYLQTFIDDFNKCRQIYPETEPTTEQTEAAENAKHLLNNMMQLFPAHGTVVKVTNIFGMEYLFIRIPDKEPDVIKQILKQMLIKYADEEFNLFHITEHLENNGCSFEEIGHNEEYFTPNFPADLEFCFDTSSIIDLTEGK